MNIEEVHLKTTELSGETHYLFSDRRTVGTVRTRQDFLMEYGLTPTLHFTLWNTAVGENMKLNKFILKFRRVRE